MARVGRLPDFTVLHQPLKPKPAAMDAASLSEGLQALPLPALLAVATGVVLLAAVVMRVLSNNFPGKAPPVEEGIPFIGGLIKFSKVSCPPAAGAAAAGGCRGRCC